MRATVAALFLLTGCASCGTEADGASEREPPAAAPLEHPAQVAGPPARLFALDDSRVLVVSQESSGRPRLSLFEGGAPQWSRRLHCHRRGWTNLGVTAAADFTTVRCPLDTEVRTFAYDTETGERRWTGGAVATPAPDSDDVYSRRHGEYLVESSLARGVRVLRVADGRLVWSAPGRPLQRGWAMDGVVSETETGMEFRTLAAERAHDLEDARLLGAFDHGLCLLREGELVHWTPESERSLATAAAVAEIGTRLDAAGLFTRCGRRGDETVLLADADSHVWVAIFASDGTLRASIWLPPTSGPPSYAGWTRELPRYLPVVPRTCEVSVVDLEEGRVNSTLALGGCSGAGYELLGVHWRTEDLFWMTADHRLFALEGASGRYLAVEAELSYGTPALDASVHGDAVWLASEGEGPITVERLTLTGPHESELARDMAGRMVRPPIGDTP